MTLKPFVIGLIAASALLRGGALAEDARRDATRITANYGVYWAGLHFGDIRLDIIVRSSDYEMKGDGQSSALGGLIYKWSGDTTSAGKLSKSGPQPSQYTLDYSGGDKHGDVRISFLAARFQTFQRCQKNDQTPKKFPSPRSSFAACSIR